MSEQLTMTEASTTTTGAPNSIMSGTAAATADALYGDKQSTLLGQTQQGVDAPPAVGSDGKPSDTPADAKAGDKPADKPTGAPDKYEFKAPEGQQFDSEVVTTFSEVAKELNLSQEAAQRVLDTMSPKMQERQLAMIQAVQTQWTDASKADKEFGGDKITENLSVAKKALDSFGTAELRSLLNESGLGNHPEIIRFMYRAGRAISEDRYVGSSTGSTPTRSTPKDFNSAAAALYTNQS